MRILLHICCACCAIYPVERLKEGGIEVTGFFFQSEYSSLSGIQKEDGDPEAIF